jgi:hypothetical protein
MDQTMTETRDQIKEYSTFWDADQITKMINQVSKREPKSQTTIDCIQLLNAMTVKDYTIDSVEVFGVMCVLNKGLIFSSLDPHIDTEKKDVISVAKTPNKLPGGPFTMSNIDEELMKLLSE